MLKVAEECLNRCHGQINQAAKGRLGDGLPSLPSAVSHLAWGAAGGLRASMGSASPPRMVGQVKKKATVHL